MGIKMELAQTQAINVVQDKVTAICNDLSSKGQKVSVRVVLSLLPEVKSTSTVHKYYKAWKDDQETNQQSQIENIGFSEEFTRVFLNEINHHAAQAERVFHEVAMDAKEQSLRAIEDVERAETLLFKQTALLELRDKAYFELQAEIPLIKSAQNALSLELRNQIEALNKQLLEQSNKNARLSSDLAKSESLFEGNKEVIAIQKAKIFELSEDVKSLNTQCIISDKEVTRLASIQESNQILVSELRETKGTLTAQNKVLDADLRAANQERQSQQSALTAAQTSLSSVKASEQMYKEKSRALSDETAQLKATVIAQNNTIKRHESSLREKGMRDGKRG